MDSVKGWAAMLCAVALGCALLQMLAPKEGLGRIFKLIAAAFFLCCLVTPLLSLKSLTRLSVDFLPEEVRADVLQERVNEQVLRQIDAALQRVTAEALEGRNIKVEKVAVQTDTSEDGGIYIERVILYMDKQNIKNAMTARQVMEQRLGVTVETEAAEE